MRPREAVLENWSSVSDAGTTTYDLKTKDLISRLLVGFRATNGATDNKDVNPARVISKVELVDGSTVLKSLSGQQAFANYFYDSRVLPTYFYSARPSAVQYVYLPLNFGRVLYDPDLSLDPKMFNNLQLKLTWNLAAIRAVGATGFVTGSAGVKIIANIIEDAPQPSGFLMDKEIYQFTSVASGDQKIDIPTDYPMRRIITRSYEAATAMATNITNHKLSIDNDKYIPFNLSTDDMIAHYQGYWPEHLLDLKLFADDTDTVETWTGFLSNAVATGGTASTIVDLTTDTASRVTIASKTDAGVASNDNPVNLRVGGYAIENTVAYTFGRWNVPSEWLQVQDFDSVKLFLTQGDAGAAVSTFIQQLKPY